MLTRILLVVALVLLTAGLIGAGRLYAAGVLKRLQDGSRGELPLPLADSDGSQPRAVVVAFSAPGCTVCRTSQAPALRHLAVTRPQVRQIHVDVSRQPDVARRFGILTAPATVVIGASGAVLAVNQGFTSADRILAQLGA